MSRCSAYRLRASNANAISERYILQLTLLTLLTLTAPSAYSSMHDRCDIFPVESSLAVST